MIIADKIIKYLKDYGDKRIKSYYFGDPLIIPAANLPSVIVVKRSSEISQGATGIDEIDKVYTIRVAISKKDELGKSPDEMAVQRTLADIVEGTTGGSWGEQSIIGILRKYFTLGDTIENQDISVEYFLSERGDLLVEEAEININIKDFINVDERS